MSKAVEIRTKGEFEMRVPLSTEVIEEEQMMGDVRLIVSDEDEAIYIQVSRPDPSDKKGTKWAMQSTCCEIKLEEIMALKHACERVIEEMKK
jgi:hypothetical protein